MALILSRVMEQELLIDGPSRIKVIKLSKGRVHLAVEADKTVKVLRAELVDKEATVSENKVFRVCEACGSKSFVESEFFAHGKCGTCGSSKTKHVFALEQRCCHCRNWLNEARGICLLDDSVALCNERCEHWEERC